MSEEWAGQDLNENKDLNKDILLFQEKYDLMAATGLKKGKGETKDWTSKWD